MPMQMKAMIADTFVSMAKEKNIDKITVKDLVETCHISRQTFYYHFQDMMDVIQWSLNQALQDVLAQSLAAKTPKDSFRVFISFTMDSGTLLFRLLRSQYREQIEDLVVQAVQSYLQALVHQRASELSIPYSDLEVALHFFSFGIVGLLLENCGKHAGDPDQLADQMYRLISGKMLNSLFQD